MSNSKNYEEIKQSFHEHMQWTTKHTAQFSKELNVSTINDSILFCQDIENIIDIFFILNTKKIKKLSEEEEDSIWYYDKEKLMSKEDILGFLSKNLLKIVYEEIVISNKLNKFDVANMKENLEVIFDEYMNIDAYTIPYLKPHLKNNLDRKLNEKIDYTQDMDESIKKKVSKKMN